MDVIGTSPIFGMAQGAGARPSGATGSVVVWVIVLIAVVMAGGLILVWLRRKIFAADQTDHAGGLMESLRSMRDSGQMSQEEYDATRKAMAARMAQGRGAAQEGQAAGRGAGRDRGGAAESR